MVTPPMWMGGMAAGVDGRHGAQRDDAGLDLAEQAALSPHRASCMLPAAPISASMHRPLQSAANCRPKAGPAFLGQYDSPSVLGKMISKRLPSTAPTAPGMPFARNPASSAASAARQGSSCRAQTWRPKPPPPGEKSCLQYYGRCQTAPNGQVGISVRAMKER